MAEREKQNQDKKWQKAGTCPHCKLLRRPESATANAMRAAADRDGHPRGDESAQVVMAIANTRIKGQQAFGVSTGYSLTTQVRPPASRAQQRNVRNARRPLPTRRQPSPVKRDAPKWCQSARRCSSVTTVSSSLIRVRAPGGRDKRCGLGATFGELDGVGDGVGKNTGPVLANVPEGNSQGCLQGRVLIGSAGPLPQPAAGDEQRDVRHRPDKGVEGHVAARLPGARESGSRCLERFGDELC